MSPEERSMLLAFFGMAAVYWAVTAMKVWLLRRRLSHSSCILAATFVVMAFVVLITPAPGYSAGDDQVSEGRRPIVWPAPAYSAAEQARLEELRQRVLVPALEAYRQTHGQYPSTLEEAGVSTPQTPYGPLHYYGSGGERPAWYLISFGDPGLNGFSADWDSRTQKWTVNEFDM